MVSELGVQFVFPCPHVSFIAIFVYTIPLMYVSLSLYVRFCLVSCPRTDGEVEAQSMLEASPFWDAIEVYIIRYSPVAD